jgi:hypothetical protein
MIQIYQEKSLLDKNTEGLFVPEWGRGWGGWERVGERGGGLCQVFFFFFLSHGLFLHKCKLKIHTYIPCTLLCMEMVSRNSFVCLFVCLKR